MQNHPKHAVMSRSSIARRIMRLVPWKLALALRAVMQRATSPVARWALRQIVRPLRFKGVPSSVSHSFRVPETGMHLMASDSLVTEHVFWLGTYGYEPGLLALWMRLCEAAREGCLEIGANIGYFTVHGARATQCRYTAVEPHPVSFTALQENVNLNGLRNVRTICAAATPTPATSVTLSVPDVDRFSTPAGAFLSASPRAGWIASTTQYDVPAIHVTDLLADVDVIKMDVEGMEPHLIQAAWTVLERRRPSVVLEVLDSPDSYWAVSQLQRQLAYRCFAPTPGGPRELSPREVDAGLTRRFARDVVLVPSDKPMPW